MALQIRAGFPQLLIDGGALANSSDCCCDVTPCETCCSQYSAVNVSISYGSGDCCSLFATSLLATGLSCTRSAAELILNTCPDTQGPTCCCYIGSDNFGWVPVATTTSVTLSDDDCDEGGGTYPAVRVQVTLTYRGYRVGTTPNCYGNAVNQQLRNLSRVYTFESATCDGSLSLISVTNATVTGWDVPPVCSLTVGIS